MAVSSKEPLVYFHLAFVAFMPGLVQLDYLLVLAGCFVVDHYVLCLRVLPEVVDSSEDHEISRLMEILDPCEVVAPGIEVFVRYGNGVDTVLFHERVLGASGPVKVEFFFEESINCRVQGEGESRGSVDPEPAIHVKAALAISKKVDFAPAQFEVFRRARGIDVSRSFASVVYRHSVYPFVIMWSSY
jgi:hypothetical protein